MKSKQLEMKLLNSCQIHIYVSSITKSVSSCYPDFSGDCDTGNIKYDISRCMK